MKHRQKTRLIKCFADREYRHAFFSGMLGASIASQIRANRQDRDWSQAELGKRAGEMRQSRISAMEDVSYQGWTINTLRRLAEALDLTLSVRFESFGKALERLDGFHGSLVEPPYARDVRIHGSLATDAPAKVLKFPGTAYSPKGNDMNLKVTCG